jgi:hypothetical protein
LVRAIDKKSCAFISFKTAAEAQKVAQSFFQNSPFKESKDFMVEYPSLDITEADLDNKSVHLVNLPHNINKVFIY